MALSIFSAGLFAFSSASSACHRYSQFCRREPRAVLARTGERPRRLHARHPSHLYGGIRPQPERITCSAPPHRCKNGFGSVENSPRGQALLAALSRRSAELAESPDPAPPGCRSMGGAESGNCHTPPRFALLDTMAAGLADMISRKSSAPAVMHRLGECGCD